MPKSIQLIKVNFSVDLYSAGEAYLRPLPETLRIVFLGLYAVVFLLGVTGNCLVIRECLCTQKRKRVSALFVCSFAISNVTIASLCMPFTVVTNLIYWEFPWYLCPTVSYIQLLVVTQRVCALVVLTLHRYRSIVHSLAKRMTKQKGAIITVLFSVLSAFFALPALFQNKSIYIVISSGVYGLCVEAWYSIHLRNLYSVAIFIVQFLIPLTILSVAHARVLRKIFRREIPGERIQARDKRLQVSRKKTVVFLVMVIIAYAIFWLPHHVITIVGEQVPSIYNHRFIHVAWIFCHWLTFCDTCTYPILILYKRFRKSTMCCTQS